MKPVTSILIPIAALALTELKQTENAANIEKNTNPAAIGAVPWKWEALFDGSNLSKWREASVNSMPSGGGVVERDSL